MQSSALTYMHRRLKWIQGEVSTLPAFGNQDDMHAHRRSAVSRQACHLLCVLAATLGARFEPLALAFLPALFKVLVITVQVGAIQISHSQFKASIPES